MPPKVSVPESWEPNPLGDLCSLLNGYAFKPRDWSSTGTPIIRIQNLNGGLDFNYYKGPILPQYEVEPGTLLFAWSGNRGTSFGPFIWKGPKGLLNQHIFKVFPSNGVDLNWFYFALDEVRQRVERDAHGAIGLVHVRRGELESYVVLTPEETEQKAITRVLQNLDEAIQQTTAVIEKLKKIKSGLLHDLLTRGIGENGELRDPVQHPERFKDSPVGKVPKPWEVKTLGQAATLQRGKDLPINKRRPGKIPVFGSNGIDGFHDEPFLNGPGVITGRSGSIGFVYYSEDPYWPLNTTLYVRDFHSNYPPFITHLLRWLRLERFAAATGVPSLNRNFVHPTLVSTPPHEEQILIVQRLQAHDIRAEAEERSLGKLKLIKQGLMHDLLTGHVRAPMKRREGKL